MIYLMMIFLISKIILEEKTNLTRFSRAPQSKQLREDNRGRPYIKDVKELEVRSSEEAIELLNMGLKRRRIAHTQLNTESSRSHSVLSMRLVQYHNDIPLTSLTKDDLTISTIHLVDLAGSERVNRAKTVGERVKEASKKNF
jgi:kinesin family protein 23